MSVEPFPLTTLGAAAQAVIDKIKRPIIRHEDGIYFDLPDESYFADDAIGSTDLKRLLISGSDYWFYSQRNPDRPDEETEARRNGHALHYCVLFGREKFDQRYVCALTKDDHPDALVTIDDIKRALREIGGSVSGKKDELMARLKGMSSRFTFWDDLHAAQLASGKTILKPEDYSRIVIASEMIRRNPALERCFENGCPEVSVFYTKNGVRRRARFDYFRLQATIDLKSFNNMMDRPVDLAINSAIFNHRYDIQASDYMDARRECLRLFNEGRVFGEIDKDWLRAAVEFESPLFVFVFYTVKGAPIARAVDIHPGGMIDGAASVEIARAIDRFKEYEARFGDGMWVDMEPRRVLTDDDIPGWLRISA